MKGLLIKDFKLLKGQMNFFFLIMIITIGISASSSNVSFTIGFCSFVMSLFSISTISYDEFDNGNAFLFSLPISRTGYTIEKYFFGLILGLSAWLFSTLIVIIAQFMKGTDLSMDFAMLPLMILPLILIMLAIMLPFQLKFGGEKARIAIIATIGLISVIFIAIAKIAEILKVDLLSIFNHLPVLNIGMLIVGAIIIAAILLLISIKISISIMNQKQF